MDLIFMLDSTESMEKFGEGVFDELKSNLSKIAGGLSSHAFVDVYGFGGDDFDSFADNHHGEAEGLVSITEDVRPELKKFVKNMQIKPGKFEQKNWREMFEYLLKNREKGKKSSGCRCFVFLILDGDIDLDLDWYDKMNLDSGLAPCTLIALGVGSPDLPMMKRMACSTDGFLSWQQPLYEVFQYMYQFIAAGNFENDVRYVEYIARGLINTLIP